MVQFYQSIKKPLYKNKQVIGLIGFSVDITDKKRTEKNAVLKTEYKKVVKKTKKDPGFAPQVSKMMNEKIEKYLTASIEKLFIVES